MQYRLKLVPNDQPNAEGRWAEVSAPWMPEIDRSWTKAARFFAPHIPSGEHMVAYEEARRSAHADAAPERGSAPA